MAGEPVVTIVGNLTGDPELRFTPSGSAVANFSVAQTQRVQRDGRWEDGATTFWRCSAWRQLGEHVAESLVKGTRVIVQGRMTTREFTTGDGAPRLSVELTVDAVGPELAFRAVAVRQPTRSGGAADTGAEEDPWNASMPAGDTEPPF